MQLTASTTLRSKNLTRQMRLFGVLVSASILLGCVQVTSEALQSANPRQVALAKSAVTQAMKDPESTRFRDGYQAYLLSNNDTVICGMVNAKNSFGGYVGFSPFYVRLRNEMVMHVEAGELAGVACNNAMSGKINVQS